MTTAFSAADARFMRLALRLAARGLGAVEPNPMVGAVVVKGGRVVGQGWHRRFGQAHAEVEALYDAGRKTRDATLYVTLEPCCHWGKQPPCTEAVLASGVRRVVVAMVDPFPAVAGKGLRILRRGGVKVEVGLLREEARELNRAFIKRVTPGTGKGAAGREGGGPWVIAKWAQTLDGCVATSTGESQWISSEESRQQVHILRGRMDGIVAGIGTVLADDPLLMARPQPPGKRRRRATGGSRRYLKRVATRIILDSQCRLPLESQLVQTVALAPVLVVHAKNLKTAAKKRAQRLAARGVMLLPVRPDTRGRPRLDDLLHYLGDMEYANVLVEGGPEVMAAFLRGGFADEAHIYVAPKLIGGRGRHALAGPDYPRLADALNLEIAAMDRIGPDVRIKAYVR